MMNQTTKLFFVHFSTTGPIGKFLLERVKIQIDKVCSSGKQIGSWKENLNCCDSIWNFNFKIKSDTLKPSFLEKSNSGIRFDEKFQNISPFDSFNIYYKNQTKQLLGTPGHNSEFINQCKLNNFEFQHDTGIKGPWSIYSLFPPEIINIIFMKEMFFYVNTINST